MTAEGQMDITYDTLQLEGTDDAVLEARAKDPKTQILFDEIDIGQTGYTHSFLFSTEGERTITFRAPREEKIGIKLRSSKSISLCGQMSG